MTTNDTDEPGDETADDEDSDDELEAASDVEDSDADEPDDEMLDDVDLAEDEETPDPEPELQDEAVSLTEPEPEDAIEAGTEIEIEPEPEPEIEAEIEPEPEPEDEIEIEPDAETVVEVDHDEAVAWYQNRWRDIQIGFVDAPQDSVAQADQLVADVIEQLTTALNQERDKLAAQWRDDGTSTEDLRVAFQGYRAFFQRLVAT